MEHNEVSISTKLTKIPTPIYFVQGDKNAANIVFHVNPTIMGVSLTGLNWTIGVMNMDNETYWEDQLTATEGATIDMTWTVNENVTGTSTKCSRFLCAVLTGYQGDTLVTQFKIEGFGVLPTCEAASTMTPDYWTNLLSELRALRDQAQAAAEIAKNVELHPVIIGDNGNYFNWVGNPESGSYVDSGRAAVGQGDMQSSVYDPNSSVLNSGGIVNYINADQNRSINAMESLIPIGGYQFLAEYSRAVLNGTQLNVFLVVNKTDGSDIANGSTIGYVNALAYGASIVDQAGRAAAILQDGTSANVASFCTITSNSEIIVYNSAAIGGIKMYYINFTINLNRN